MRNPFEEFADTVDDREVGEERIIDFDIEANTGYEIESSVVVDEDERVKEASVRFGEVEEREEIGVGSPIIGRAFDNKVRETPAGSNEAVEADIGDFGRTVPHLRVDREKVEFGAEPPTIDEFAETVKESADFTNNILRGDTETIDNNIDDFL